MITQNLCLGCMEDKGPEATCPYCGWLEGTQAESPLHLPAGTVLVEKYLLGRVLGQGGFGITYLAWDLFLERKLAVKEFFPRDFCYRDSGYHNVSIYSGTTHEQYEYGLDKFLAEGKTLARFDGHPNIVSVRDFFKANETAYLVMSYLDGTTLCNYLAAKNEQLAYEETMQIMVPVLDALRAVHKENLLHRDISPDNIMISKKGHIIILDFGAARHAIGESDKQYSIVLKPGFAPEEQYRSNGLQGPWTDIYAAAATMYRTLTGSMPPESLDRLNNDTLIRPSELGIAIPEQQEIALLTAMAVKAEHRYQQVEDFQNALSGSPDLTGSGPEPCQKQFYNNETLERSREHGSHNEDEAQKIKAHQAMTVNIGRAADNDLVLEESTISRYHAKLHYENGSWYISDLDSTHGTFLNGTSVQGIVEIPAGSWITFSSKKIHFDGKAFYLENGQKLFDINNYHAVLNPNSAVARAKNVVTRADSGKNNSKLTLLLPGSLMLAAILAPLFYYLLSQGLFSTGSPALDHAEEAFIDSSDEVPQQQQQQTTAIQDRDANDGTIVTLEFSNGIYTGEVKNGVPDGYGVFVYTRAESATGGLQSGTSRQFEGYWKDGKMHGEGTLTYPNGHTKRGIWVEGVFTSN